MNKDIEQIPSYYINNTNIIASSDGDFRFIFGEKIHNVRETIQCFVVMTPIQFKAVYKLMTAHIKAYEEINGEIKVSYEPNLKSDSDSTKPKGKSGNV